MIEALTLYTVFHPKMWMCHGNGQIKDMVYNVHN